MLSEVTTHLALMVGTRKAWRSTAGMVTKSLLQSKTAFSHSYYFFDCMDSDSVFFCSIIEYLDNHQTFRMYHFTIDKQRQAILHADWIAVQSSKNGYRVNDRMNYNPKGNKLIVNSTFVGNFHNFRGRTQSVRETFCFSSAGTTRKTLKR